MKDTSFYCDKRSQCVIIEAKEMNSNEKLSYTYETLSSRY